MSYTPTEWKTGDVITADKLNNMENGIVNAPGVAVFEFEVITNNDNQVVTEATVEQVADSFNSGKLCVARIMKHASNQPAKDSEKTDCVFRCFGEGTMVSVSWYFVQEAANGAISIDVYNLTGNMNGWSFSVQNLKATAAENRA